MPSFRSDAEVTRIVKHPELREARRQTDRRERIRQVDEESKRFMEGDAELLKQLEVERAGLEQENRLMMSNLHTLDQITTGLEGPPSNDEDVVLDKMDSFLKRTATKTLKRVGTLTSPLVVAGMLVPPAIPFLKAVLAGGSLLAFGITVAEEGMRSCGRYLVERNPEALKGAGLSEKAKRFLGITTKKQAQESQI